MSYYIYDTVCSRSLYTYNIQKVIQHTISKWFIGLGVSYDSGCSTVAPNSSFVYNTTDNVTDVYPCEFGFHYLVVSGAVWITFLPLWICGLFGNCWRQECWFIQTREIRQDRENINFCSSFLDCLEYYGIVPIQYCIQK